MNIKINKPYLILKECDITNLPDFIVLTGENGSGKTQFLNYLYTRITKSPLPSMMMQDPSMMSYDPMMQDPMMYEGELIFDENGFEILVIYIRQESWMSLAHVPFWNIWVMKRSNNIKLNSII